MGDDASDRPPQEHHRSKKKKGSHKSRLRRRLEQLRDEFRVEENERIRLTNNSRATKDRKNQLRDVALDCQKESERFDAFIDRNEAAIRKPPDSWITESRQWSFIKEEPLQPYKVKQGGPSSRRTAFTRNYVGTPIMGESEQAINLAFQKRALAREKIMFEEAEAALQRQLAGQAATPDPMSVSPSLAPSPTSPTTKRRTEALKHLNIAGNDSHPDLDRLKRCSLRRTRMYTDYENAFILMDRTDWPQHSNC